MTIGPRTLTARLVATMVVLVALVSVLVVAASAAVMNRYLIGQLDDSVRNALQRAANPQPEGPDGQPKSSDQDSDRPSRSLFAQAPGTIVMVSIDDESLGWVITDAGGRRTLATTTRARLAKVPRDGHGHTIDLSVGDYRVMAGVDASGNKFVVGQPTRDNYAILRSLLKWSLLFVVGFVLLAALLGRELVRRQLRPLREVAATADAVTQQQLSTGDPSISPRVEEANTDPGTEVGAVGHALNTLLDHMSQALEARHRSELQVRQFVGDASHELRTPLATIHGYAQLSRRTPDDPVALSNALAKVETEADRMSSLVEDLLLLARLDAGRPLERVEVDVTRLLLESVVDARVLSPAHKWQLDLPEEPVTVLGDERRLHQVVTNLLSNARHHTPPGTTVTVSARKEAPSVRVVVHDDGPGLPPELTATVFERFTRGDSSRTRASGGAGLGLSLVSAIAEAHGGSAQVTSQPGSTTFTVLLPS